MGRATVVAGRAEYTECWGRELGCVYADNTKAYFWGMDGQFSFPFVICPSFS